MQASITKQLVAKERQLHNSSLELAALKSGKPGQVQTQCTPLVVTLELVTAPEISDCAGEDLLEGSRQGLELGAVKCFGCISLLSCVACGVLEFSTSTSRDVVSQHLLHSHARGLIAWLDREWQRLLPINNHA